MSIRRFAGDALRAARFSFLDRLKSEKMRFFLFVRSFPECPLLALSGHAPVHCECPLSGVKRTYPIAVQMSANDPKRTLCSKHSWPCSAVDVRFFVQNDIEQRGVDFDLAVVVNQTQFSKFVHKKAHAGARRADHLRERLLADLGDDERS